MPKSVIREFDNSNTGNILSTNFSVFVPGYANPEKNTEALKKEAENLGIYFKDDGIYRFNSQAQFIKFIGKFGGDKQATAPVLEELQAAASGIEKYRRALTADEVRDYYLHGPNGDKTLDFKYYIGTTVGSSEADYGADKYLVKTFVGVGEQGANETIKFTELKDEDLWLDADGDETTNDLVPNTLTTVYKIKNDTTDWRRPYPLKDREDYAGEIPCFYLLAGRKSPVLYLLSTCY